ncbi:MAG TPA: fimbrial protein [Ramlibacter sp.]|uniref:fimbrial protein n=1 Tax=Ramlibacter sp. TaxID=1917967 RepID=UPI002D7F16FF|nr:fimbrial protein [Ramlibacter sp.]HET8747750.1 fimbrial protein [Ramlibacter sp.]
MKTPLLKIVLAAVFALLLVNPGAWARCYADDDETTTIEVLAGSGGKLIVPTGSPVGTTVWSSPVVTLPPVSVDCRGQGQAYAVHATSLQPSGVANVYKTGIPYLGVRIVEVTSFTSVRNSPTRWATPALNFKGALSPSYQVSLVVIAPVTAGGDSASVGEIAFDYISDSPDALVNARMLHRLRLKSFNTQTPGTAPCTTSDVTVNLGSRNASEFGGPGSTTAATDFTIELRNCPSGAGRIAYQIDPATAVVPGTGNTVVALDAASTAAGVGVQLLDATGAPLAMASKRTVANSGGNYSIPLKARYYKTGPTVGGGAANSAMTFTISYN